MRRPNAFLVIGIVALVLLGGSLLLAAPASELAPDLRFGETDDAPRAAPEPYSFTIDHEFTPSANGGLQREEVVAVPESSLRGSLSIRFEGDAWAGPATVRILDPHGRVALERSIDATSLNVGGGMQQGVSSGFVLEPGEWRVQFEGNGYARGVAVIENL